ncbi:hypothetical protein [Haloarchaeobius amylolyticus]|uniref:hypothetical protein n=1 Tax=Haloarchaeobius amylolyticus TaxID=1198296 RepID=UPI00226DD3F0|nr:hypothetical protein [Haloarchaeobius amylolyticus]
MDSTELTETEIEALHRTELALEWLRRAHGHLLEFHHGIGHAMDHLDGAEELLRESGHTDLADQIRDKHLPRGVIDRGPGAEGDRWSYDVVETFEDGFLGDVIEFEAQTRSAVADGARHVSERRQEREWRERANPERR